MEVPILYSPHDRSCPCAISVRRGSHLRRQFGQVLVGRVQRIAAFDLRPNGNLQQLRRREVPALQLGKEGVGEINLDSWHAPNYTPTNPRRSTTDHPISARMSGPRP